MQRKIAACVALFLLLAGGVWWLQWLDVRDVVDSSAERATGVKASGNLNGDPVADHLPSSRAEVASREMLNSTLPRVVDMPEAPTESAAQVGVGASSRSRCLRAEEEMPEVPSAPNSNSRNDERTEVGTSALNKEACYTAFDEVKKARWVFDATSTQAVWYSAVRPFNGSLLREIVLQEMCAGDRPFDAASEEKETKSELFFVTSKETTKVLIGPYWITDGTVLSRLTEEQYSSVTKILMRGRQDVIGSGGSLSRELFDKGLKERYFNRITAEEEARKRSDKELQFAQQRLPADCLE